MPKNPPSVFTMPTPEQIKKDRPSVALREANRILEEIARALTSFEPGTARKYKCSGAADVQTIVVDALDSAGWHVFFQPGVPYIVVSDKTIDVAIGEGLLFNC